MKIELIANPNYQSVRYSCTMSVTGNPTPLEIMVYGGAAI